MTLKWSFSALQTFEQCPRKYKAKYVLKNYNEPQQDHQQWGIDVHKDLEDRVRENKPLPERTRQYEPVVQSLAKFGAETVLCEQKMGLTENLTPVDFFAPEVWWRGVIDLALIKGDKAVIVDYKTGKRKDDFTQLRLFSAAMFARHPHLRKQKMTYLWLKTGEHSSEEMTNTDTPAVWQTILPRVDRLEKAIQTDTFYERPGPLCGWCWEHTCKHARGGLR